MKHILVIDSFDVGSHGNNKFGGGVELHNYILCRTLSELKYKVTTIQVIAEGCENPNYNLKNVEQIFLETGPKFLALKDATKENRKSLAMRWSRDIKNEVRRAISNLSDVDYAINNYRANMSLILLEYNIPTIQPLHAGTSTLGGMVGTVTNRVYTPMLEYKNKPSIFKLGYASEYVAHDFKEYANKHINISIDKYLHPYHVGISTITDEVKPSNGNLFFITRTSPEKRLHISLEIAYKNKIPTTVYTTIGDYEYFEKRIKKYVDCDFIEFHFDAPYDVIMEDLKNARALVMDCSKETFGLVGLEAMERGVPIIYHDNGSSIPPQDSIVHPQLNSIVYKSRDIDDHTDKLVNLNLGLNDRNTIARLTRDKFSIKQWKTNLNKLFKSMAKENTFKLF